MSATTVVCQIVDQLGFAMWRRRAPGGRMPVVEIRSTPAATFEDIQPETIFVTMGHNDTVIGRCHYLEHGIQGTDLRAVGIVDVEPEAVTGLYCSGEVIASMPIGGGTARSCRLEGVGLVGRTANTGVGPVVALPGDYRSTSDRSRWDRPPKILERAARDHTEHRSAQGGMRIHRPSSDMERRAAGLPPIRYERPIGVPIEWSKPHPGIISVT